MGWLLNCPCHVARPFMAEEYISEASLEERGYYTPHGSCHSAVTDYGSGNCSNAFCPLGTLGSRAGSKTRACPLVPSSPCRRANDVPTPVRPATPFLPLSTVVTRTPPCSTPLRADDLFMGAASASADASSAAPTAACPCCQDSHCFPEDLFCGTSPASNPFLAVTTPSSPSRSLRKAPPSTGRLLMVDWTPPASFSTRSHCNEQAFPFAPAKKKYKKDGRISRFRVPVVAASVYDQDTSGSASAPNSPVRSSPVIVLRRACNPQHQSQNTASYYNSRQRSRVDTESRAAGLSTGDTQGVRKEFPRLPHVVFDNVSSLCGDDQPLYQRSAERNKSRTPVVLNRSSRTLHGHVGSHSLQNRALSAQNGLAAAQPLYSASRSPNSPVCVGKVSVFVGTPGASLPCADETKCNELLLPDTPQADGSPVKEVTSAVVSSRVRASNSGPSSAQGRLMSCYLGGMQRYESDESPLVPTPVLQNLLLHLQHGECPFATEETRKNRSLMVGARTISNYLADMELPPTGDEVTRLLSVLLWPSKLGALQLYPALFKVICTEWTRLKRSEGLQYQKQ